MIYALKYKYNRFEELISFLIYKNDCCLNSIISKNDSYNLMIFKNYDGDVYLQIYEKIKNFLSKFLDNDISFNIDYSTYIVSIFMNLKGIEFFTNKKVNNFNEKLFLDLFKISKNKDVILKIFNSSLCFRKFILSKIFNEKYRPNVEDFPIFLPNQIPKKEFSNILKNKISTFDGGEQILKMLDQ